MRLTVFRALILGVLMAALVVPVGELQALTWQQQPPKASQPQEKQPKKPEQQIGRAS